MNRSHRWTRHREEVRSVEENRCWLYDEKCGYLDGHEPDENRDCY